MKIFSTFLFLLVTFSLTAQVTVNNGWRGRLGKRVNGNGDLVAKDREVGGFTGIKACCSMDVKVSQGSQHSVTVEAESNLQKFIKTEVSGNTLTVRYGKNANFKSTEPITVYISLPRLEMIRASSSSEVIGQTAFTGDELTLDVSSSANIRLRYSGDRVDLDGSSSGQIEIEGSAMKVSAKASSSARIDADGLKAEEGRADVSSGAKVDLHTKRKIKADASSGATVRYSGKPEDVYTDTSSGGSVRPKN